MWAQDFWRISTLSNCFVDLKMIISSTWNFFSVDLKMIICDPVKIGHDFDPIFDLDFVLSKVHKVIGICMKIIWSAFDHSHYYNDFIYIIVQYFWLKHLCCFHRPRFFTQTNLKSVSRKLARAFLLILGPLFHQSFRVSHCFTVNSSLGLRQM